MAKPEQIPIFIPDGDFKIKGVELIAFVDAMTRQPSPTLLRSGTFECPQPKSTVLDQYLTVRTKV